jgi:hypothetical protein
MNSDHTNETSIAPLSVAEADGVAEATAWVEAMDCSEELFGCDFNVFNSLEQTETSVLDYDSDASCLCNFPLASAF